MLKKYAFLLFLPFIFPPSVFGQNLTGTVGTNLLFTTYAPLKNLEWNKTSYPQLGLQAGVRYSFPLKMKIKPSLTADFRFYRTHLSIDNTWLGGASTNVSGNLVSFRFHLAPSVCIPISQRFSIDLGYFWELPTLSRFYGTSQNSYLGSTDTKYLSSKAEILDNKNQGLWISPRFKINDKGTSIFMSYNMGTKAVYYNKGLSVWYGIVSLGVNFPL
jgi:hypothetical protein